MERFQIRCTFSSSRSSFMKWLGPIAKSRSSSLLFAASTRSATHNSSSFPLSTSHLWSSPWMGSRSGKNPWKWKRRRNAASTKAIDRSAVFMVPIILRFSGSLNSPSEYCNVIDRSRYSRRKKSSPSTFDRFARLISSITKTNVASGLSAASAAIRFKGPSVISKPPSSLGRHPSMKSS